MIECSMPSDWRSLQQRVARILNECGLEVEVEKNVDTVRGSVNIDVHAVDRTHRPVTLYLCECKHWRTAVPKTIVHAFRTVIADYGANWGLIISSAGFQSGAFEAAHNSNVRLVTWAEFQDLFEDRWVEHCLAPRLRNETDPLVEYTEPINSRVFRKADQLDEAGQKRFTDLREKYRDIAFLAVLWSIHHSLWLGGDKLKQPDKPLKPSLPLRKNAQSRHLSEIKVLPEDILDAACLRDFVEALCKHIRQGIAEFDEVFGGRA